ncbi:MAG TPA: hypothetical protein VER98_06680 [Terriglobia bacterium]|nr:hypothetical protein [Terriglobia bacterium]
MSLGTLILLDIVNQNLQTAVDSSMVEVETESANLQGLAATLMLSRIDPSVRSRRQPCGLTGTAPQKRIRLNAGHHCETEQTVSQ